MIDKPTRMRNGLILWSILLFINLSNGQATPCSCCSEAHAAFDFWIGNWEVTLPDGSRAGENTIKKEQNGCLLKENWVSAKGGFTGTSTNYFNAGTGEWEQLWIDNSGTLLKLKGNRVRNQMILRSDPFVQKDGTPAIHQITWTANDDGSVRQIWEVLQEEKMVSVLFDGLYKRKQ
jgi:hypothetical protein